MTRRRRSLAIGLLLTIAACGGDDAPDANDTAPPASSTAPTPATIGSGPVAPDPETADGPTPTIAADLPEEFLPGVGPVALIGDSLPVLPADGDDPAIGMRAPVLVGQTFAGEPVRVDAATDGPTWFVFLAHWCPHCNDEIPVINQLRDDGRIPDGLDVVGVSTAVSPERPNWPPDEWLVDQDWTYTAIPDGVDTAAEQFIAASAFGVTGFPFSVLVDGDGTVVQRWSGGREADEIVSLLTSNLSPAG